MSTLIGCPSTNKLAQFAPNACEAEEFVLPLQNHANDLGFYRLRLCADATLGEITLDIARNSLQRLRLHSELSFGLEDLFDKFPSHVMAVFL